MTLLPTAIPAVAAPPVLLPYQQEWLADRAKVKLYEKSRRIGISWAEAADDTLYASSKAGDDVWYIGYNLDMAREFINDCADWARHYQLAAGEVEETVIEDEGRDIQTLRIRFPSGHKVSALSSRPTNLRGKQGRVVIDEAAFHDDLKGLLKAALALLVWGGQVRIISTHFGDANPFNELVQECRAGKKPYSVHRTTFDEALEQGLYQRVCLTLGKDYSAAGEAAWRAEIRDFYGADAEEELDCVPSQGTGVWLTRALITGCLRAERPVLRLVCDAEFVHRPQGEREGFVEAWCETHLAPLLAALDTRWKSYFGEDFGRSGDLTVLVPAQELANLDLAAPFVVELRNVPFEQQRQVVFYLLDRLPRFSGAAFDARGNGQYLAEVAMQRYGAGRVLQVMPTEPWYREVTPKVKARFEDRSLTLPQDSELLDDLRAVQVVKGVARVPEARTQAKSGQRHGDAAVAVMMLEHAVQTCAGEMVYDCHSIRRPADDADAFARTVQVTAGFGARQGAL